MRKITDVLCLILWSISLGFGILAWCINMMIHPLCYVMTTFVICLHYIQNLMGGD